MYLSTITLKNFRKYAYDGANKHGITVNFHKGLNALIGENDSGKSAIIECLLFNFCYNPVVTFFD